MEVTVDITGAQNSSSLEQLPSGLLIKFRPRGHGEAVSSCIPCCQEQINYRTFTEIIYQDGLDGTKEQDGPDGQSYCIPAVAKTICDKNARAWISTISNLNEWFNLQGVS